MADQTNPPSAGVPQAPLTVEQRLANLYGAKVAPPDEPPATEEAQEVPEVAEQEEQQPEASATDEPSPDDLPDEGDGEPTPQIGDEFHIVHNGIEHKLDRAKTIELAQKGFDYTAKTQRLAEQQKQTQELLQKANEIAQLQPHLADELAQVKAAERALSQWQNVDWVALATNEPLEYPKYRAQYDQLVQTYNIAHGTLNQKAAAVQAKLSEVSRGVVEQEMEKLREYMPAMRDPAKFKAEAEKIKTYGLADGYTASELESITDARMIRTLWKAAQYDALVKGKAERNKQLRSAPPTAKPGALNTTQSAESKRIAETRQRLKKTGNWQDAAELIARMK